jgi:arylsulfatase A-like enzyme
MNQTLFLPLLLIVTGVLCGYGQSIPEPRPNILWIVSEDNSPLLGCYGDANAKTPNLDRLAEKGIRYANAFANAPVCAVARSSWIFGVPAVTTGTLHHRSKYRVPRENFKTYPEYLKDAGYYTTNNSKTDYNTNSIDPDTIWDESSNQAHFKHAPENTPFFAVFNYNESHESGIFPKNKNLHPRVKAEAIELPPYQAKTTENIYDWQKYYDRLELMDKQVGKILQELEAAGQAENTIVVYCSDHGGVTLRTKRFLHDSGTRVPLIVYFPEKWQHLAPQAAGTVSDRLVQFVDMSKTWISLAGLTPPEVMPGYVFLGEHIEPAPDSVFLFSGRFDEAPANSRAVTDGRWKYIRNFEPDRTPSQMLIYPNKQDGQVSQWEAYNAGKTNAKESAHFLPQPSEELYDTESDPHEVNNLVDTEPVKLAEMQELLDQHILANRDLGFIPELIMETIDQNFETTVYAFGQSQDNYPLPEVLELAKLAASKDSKHLPVFIESLKNENPVMRYWAAIGLRVLGPAASPAREAIMAATTDPSASVRIVAAVALGNLGQRESAIQLLIQEAKVAKGEMGATWALDGIKLLDAPEAIQAMSTEEIKALDKGNYPQRIIDVLQAGGSAQRLPAERL